MPHGKVRVFVCVWNSSGSVTEASVRLRKAGYSHFSPEVALVFSYALRGMGFGLKDMPRGDLPDFVDTGASAWPAG